MAACRARRHELEKDTAPEEEQGGASGGMSHELEPVALADRTPKQCATSVTLLAKRRRTAPGAGVRVADARVCLP